MATTVIINAQSEMQKKVVYALLRLTHSYAFPNGNSGYDRSELKAHEQALTPHGVNFKRVQSGNAHIPATIEASFAEKANIPAIKQYILSLLRERVENNKNDWWFDAQNVLRNLEIGEKSHRLSRIIGDYMFDAEDFDLKSPFYQQKRDEFLSVLDTLS